MTETARKISFFSSANFYPKSPSEQKGFFIIFINKFLLFNYNIRILSAALSIQLLILLLAVRGGKNASSKEIARRIKEGDESAFKEFFDAHYNLLYRFLKSKGISNDIAEDLIQNAYLYIWEKRKNIDENKSLRSYLYKIAYTRMLNHVKYQKRFEEAEIQEKEYADAGPEEKLRGKQLKDILQKLIESMPDKRGAVFELCFIQEFTYKETAEMMEISVNTVENHMTKAFKDIRPVIESLYNKNE